MISANLQGVAELVVRRAQRQGYVRPREVCEVLSEQGLSESLWKDVVAVARPSLKYRRGRYYYEAPVSPRVAQQQSMQRAIERAIGRLLSQHRQAQPQLERRVHERMEFIQPVQVQTEDGHQYTVLTRDISASGIRLVGTRRFLGQKLRVIISSGGSKPWVFIVQILWTCTVGTDLVENGGAFIEMGQAPR